MIKNGIVAVLGCAFLIGCASTGYDNQTKMAKNRTIDKVNTIEPAAGAENVTTDKITAPLTTDEARGATY